MTSQICVDSGILLKLLLNEPDSHIADRLWQNWIVEGVELIAPYLLPIEVTAVLRKLVHRGLLDAQLGEQLLKKGLALGVMPHTFQAIHSRAWRIATRFNRPTAYDAHYLALAEQMNCEFWTADRRLCNVVQVHLPWVHHLHEFADL